jgi:hypothetical protein
VDVVIAWDKERLVTKNVIYDATTIAVLAKNELIQMKKQSGRPQDLEDIKALRKLL